MADMSYEDQLANIGQLSTDDLTKLSETIIASFGDAEAQDDLDAMASAADALDQVRAAQATAAGNTPNTETTSGGETGESVDPIAASTEVETAELPEAVVADAVAVAEPEVEVPEVVAEKAEQPESLQDKVAEKKAAAAEAEPEAPAEVPAETETADGVTAAGLPAALKDHEFKKSGKKKPEDDEDDDAVTAASDIPEETTVPVEQTDIPEDRQPLVATSTTTIVAGADIPQRAAGSEYQNYGEVSEAFTNRLRTVQNSRGGDGERLVVASVQATVDPERTLETGSDQSNYDKIDAVTRAMKTVDRGALVASGGYCAPLETRYDIFGVGVTDRPIRDSLAGFQATRGGIRYVQPPILSSFSGAVGLWTAANDASPSNPATKPFLTAACQSEVTVTADAVTLEIQFGNLMTRAYPELVARNNELGLIYQARFAEQTLLNKISALSTSVSASWKLGTARDFLNSLGRLAAGYRTRHRLDPENGLRAIVPAWVRDAIREDLTQGSPSPGVVALEWADDIINAFLAARNINITWHLDDALYTSALVSGNVPDFPATIIYYLFAEGTFLFLDGGTLDLGIVRDSTLVGTNDYRMFVETFEGLAKVGIESIKATVTTHVTGANTGTVTPA